MRENLHYGHTLTLLLYSSQTCHMYAFVRERDGVRWRFNGNVLKFCSAGCADVVRCGTYMEGECTVFKHPTTTCRVVELKHIRLNLECNLLGLAWSKRNLLKALEFLDLTVVSSTIFA